MGTRIGVAMIVKDEERMIGECLRRVVKDVDEIVVLDTGSTDGTRDVARSIGANVIEAPWDNHFGSMRNKSITALASDYVFVLDADERVEMGFRAKLDRFIEDHPNSLGIISIRSPWTDHKGNRSIVRSQNTRFFPRSPDIRFEGSVHEQVVDIHGARSRYHTGVTAWHEGYDLSADLLAKKTTRNISILLSEFDHTPRTRYFAYQLGKSLYNIGDFNEAAAHFEFAVQHCSAEDAYHPDLLLASLYNLKELKASEPLWPLLERAVMQYPTLVDLHFFLGRALIEFQIPDLNLIRQSFETCLTLGEVPDKRVIVEGVDSYLALYNLGVFYESTGELALAGQFYSRSLNFGYARAGNALRRVGRG